jgi:vacuolar-type H+-ATPase subunit E/Vma4
MSLESITRKILEDAGARAAAIDKEAREAEDETLRAARERARAAIDRARSESSAEAQRIAAEARAGAEIEASTALLRAKGEATERGVADVMVLARRSLLRSKMPAILESSIRYFKRLSGDSPVIATDRRNAALVKGKAYKVEPGDADGFVLYSSDRSLSLDATVDSMVSREADAARGLVAAELFHGHDAGRSSRAEKQTSASPTGRRSGKAGRAGNGRKRGR